MNTAIPLPELDISVPIIPPSILCLLDPEAQISVDFVGAVPILWEEIWQELIDPAYTNRAHHNVGTYDRGCRGPLCRKARREHPKRKRPEGPPYTQREERVFDPVAEYFHTVAKHRLLYYKREMLQRLM